MYDLTGHLLRQFSHAQDRHDNEHRRRQQNRHEHLVKDILDEDIGEDEDLGGQIGPVDEEGELDELAAGHFILRERGAPSVVELV